MKGSSDLLRVGITIGDLNGIGMEVIIKALIDNRILTTCTPIVYGNARAASAIRKVLRINDFSFNIIKNVEEAHTKKANLINVWEEEVNIELGKPSTVTGEYAFRSLEAASKDLAEGKIDVIVTAPINKKTIQSDKFNFPGHTEYFTKLSNVSDSLMLLVANDLRVGTVTSHIPISEVSGALNKALIVSKIKLLEQSLIKDFLIDKPKIAVLGLNPHAGDAGLLGNEEIDVIKPAIKEVSDKGALVYGPYAADGFFASENIKNFDGILAMYHDQGLAPFKAISFDEGVNYTAGLPIVRTSPDHGTGYEIAGKGIASENSLRNAIYLACDVYNNRKQYKEMNGNKLQAQRKSEKE